MTARWIHHAALSAYVPNAVTFDGTNDALVKTTALTGVSNSKLLTMAFSAYLNAGSIVQDVYNSILDTGGDGVTRMEARFESFQNTIRFFGRNSSGGTILDLRSNALSVSTLYNILFSCDMSDTAKRHLYVNDSSSMQAPSTYVDDTFSLDTTHHAIGARPVATNQRLNGELIDFSYWPGLYVDFSVTATRRLVFGASGEIIWRGEQGEGPFGVPAAVHLWGATGSWHQNKGTGGGFDLVGTLANGTHAPSGAY